MLRRLAQLADERDQLARRVADLDDTIRTQRDIIGTTPNGNGATPAPAPSAPARRPGRPRKLARA
jgi:hypothetical protein